MDDLYMSRVPPDGNSSTEPESMDDNRSSSGKSQSGSISTPEAMRCKRKITLNQSGYGLSPIPPAAVARRNERERNRVKLVNLGFATLKNHVPNGVKNKKMSKVDTLRSAVEYIRQLQQVLLDRQADLRSYSNEENCKPTDSRDAMPQSSRSSSYSVASSPVPSCASDSSYEALSPEDEELLDFTTWF